MEAYLRRTILWYGGVGLLTARVVRNVALPRRYFRLVIHEIEVMGVRSLPVAMIAAVFTGMVFALQSAINMARFGAENYVGPVVAMALFRELGVNYVKRLIVPRLLAALVVFPLLTSLADVIGLLGSMVIMFIERGTDL